MMSKSTPDVSQSTIRSLRRLIHVFKPQRDGTRDRVTSFFCRRRTPFGWPLRYKCRRRLDSSPLRGGCDSDVAANIF
jgi:hypothetical protein